MKNYVLVPLAASAVLLLTANCEQATDVSCDDYACPEGTKCELEHVVCIRAPCPPLRNCVPVNDTSSNGGNSRSKREAPDEGGHYPNNDPCSVVRCRERCIVVQDCSEGPCRPRAKCVSSNEES